MGIYTFTGEADALKKIAADGCARTGSNVPPTDCVAFANVRSCVPLYAPITRVRSAGNLIDEPNWLSTSALHDDSARVDLDCSRDFQRHRRRLRHRAVDGLRCRNGTKSRLRNFYPSLISNAPWRHDHTNFGDERMRLMNRPSERPQNRCGRRGARSPSSGAAWLNKLIVSNRPCVEMTDDSSDIDACRCPISLFLLHEAKP